MRRNVRPRKKREPVSAGLGIGSLGEILTIEARVVVASVDTFLHYAEEITEVEQAAIAAAPGIPA